MKDIDYIKVFKDNEVKVYFKDIQEQYTYQNYKHKTPVDTFILRILTLEETAYTGYILEEV